VKFLQEFSEVLNPWFSDSCRAPCSSKPVYKASNSQGWPPRGSLYYQ